MNALKAMAIALVYWVLLIVSMPGVSFLKKNLLLSHADQQRFERRHGRIALHTVATAADLNRARRPLAEAIGGFQPLFRVRQSWHLYRDGPRMIRRMEIRVDGDLIYRSNDPKFSWNEAIFKHRRIRPMVETLVKKPKAKNRVGLARFIVNHAKEDFPGVQRIDISSFWGDRKGKTKRHHRIIAEAPNWTLQDQK